MLEKMGRLTERKALAFDPPATGYVLHWCPQTPGFGLRVTTAGARSWISERRVNGKTVRRTLGKATGRGAISADAARKLMVEVSSELQRGIDRAEDQRAERIERRKAEASEGLTFEKALREYTAGKRRGRDGLPLKARTVADYLQMIEGSRIAKDNHAAKHVKPERERKPAKATTDGELFAIAHKPLTSITAADIRSLHAAAAKRGARRATYAMQVLRAVLNWHGVKVAGNPLSKDVAGRERIVLAKTTGAPAPIPPERLAAWWKAATDSTAREAADFYRLSLLTGARGGELKAVHMRDVDLEGARIVLRDTKNRTDHVLLLSTQAAAIVARQAKSKRPAALLFDIGDPRKTLAAINAAAGTTVRPHGLRATFASVAEELVSAYALKRMLNHTDAGDVTGGHYVGKSQTQLRTAWQAVADAITGP